ncbi:S1C family serine protease [Nocardia sp. NPDC051570]|uniref:S1C family serine protease n=1 Tax=Nocardia sp. NPDC051570 TaxID=3364324 RepID=UPI0037AFEFB8
MAAEVRLQAQLSTLAGAADGLALSVVAVHADDNGSGSGIVLDTTGLVLTNGHVVDKSTRITVEDASGTHAFRATVLGIDPLHDIALLKLDSPPGLPAARIDTTLHPQPGSAVLAIGYAGGRAQPTATTGTVEALNQRIRSDRLDSIMIGLMAVNAHAEPGDSGGALFDPDGRVIGLITAIATDNPTTLVIPIDEAIDVASTWATR